MMLRLIQNELYKMVRLKKLYIFMAILAVHAWLTVYFYNAGGEWKSVIVVPNGQSLPLTLLNSMAQFMIVFIPIYVADMITSEVNNGTLKLSLLCPVRRIEWLCAKIVSLFAFLVVLLACSIAAEYVIGTLAFGWEEQTLYAGTLYSQSEGVWLTLRLAFSMLLPYMACGMIVIIVALSAASISAAIGLSIGILTAAQYLNIVDTLKPYSIVNQMYFFHESIHQANIAAILQNVVVLAGYLIVSYFISAIMIKKKDFIL
ncbi:ABC transporter permease [Paenibacillus ihumii]|uniref:ABC transporter permease n=1 Tax=Paenibacillus ihumii TaxID=687436 RepID=UPI0006D80048|nr:ABC transporter permease [Paenibacillus ihumii]